MNNKFDLIQKLEQFPPDELCKFYCPINRSYFYITKYTDVRNYHSRNVSVILHMSKNAEFDYMSYDEVLYLLKTRYKFTLLYNNTEFRFL